MNTKLFFLLTAILLISTATLSFAGAGKKPIAIEHAAHTTDLTMQDDAPIPVDLPVDQIPDKELPKKIHKPNSEEDGKQHHCSLKYLYFRIGRKAFAIFVCKFILIVAHIACSLYCLHHAFH